MDKCLAFGIMMFAFGLACGMLLTDFLWRVKIREKATTGFRLPVWGKLYNVSEDKPLDVEMLEDLLQDSAGAEHAGSDK
jgi:hypothetical protein